MANQVLNSQMEAANRRFETAFEQDANPVECAKAVAALYTEEGTLWIPGSDNIQGQESNYYVAMYSNAIWVTEEFQKIIRQGARKISLNLINVEPLDNIDGYREACEYEFKTANDQPQAVFGQGSTGQFIGDWRRVDGEWRLYFSIFTTLLRR